MAWSLLGDDLEWGKHPDAFAFHVPRTKIEFGMAAENISTFTAKDTPVRGTHFPVPGRLSVGWRTPNTKCLPALDASGRMGLLPSDDAV